MTEGKRYLEMILKKLHTRIGELNDSLEAGQKEIEGMHEYYWENYTEMDQYGYENFDNQQALLTQINTNQQQIHQRSRFRRMLDAPFFGRVDFCYEGEEEAESFYIGIGNFSAKAGAVPLIYDWRAPVSGLFYDYDKGPGAYEAPGGWMQGEITSKWQYKIRHGEMVYEFESDVKIDDEILMAELGTNGDVQLKNIIRTIQKEQNAIIRNTKDRIMVIQGVAGSGKTSVALHRIAYLLYHERGKLSSSNVLVLSPNGVFSDYISHVLPELGEENILQMSFDLFAWKELQKVVSDCEDRYDQIERFLITPESENERVRQSEEFLDEMEAYLLTLEDELMNFKDVGGTGGLLRNYTISASRLIDLFYDKFLDFPLLSRMEAVQEYLQDEYETLLGRDLSEEEVESFASYFQGMYETTDLYVLYSQFLESAGYEPLPDVPYEKRKLSYEDVYPMLYMKYRLWGSGQRRQIRHLVIDEMQDYSPLQYRILSMLFTCRMTILGDKAQTMETRQRDAVSFLPKILGRDMKILEMNKSYRNTVEIGSYAANLQTGEKPELFNRHGKPIVEEKKKNLKDVVESVWRELKIKENGYETAALLTMSMEEAREVYRLLREKVQDEGENLHLIDRDSSDFNAGLTVTTFYLAKGLEFDQVFTMYGKQADSPLIKQARYICATRALHELYMYELTV